ncbi:MAG: hypothetical protein H7201_17425 [Candidatus Saccharibacteria bacterium]|nr:hypothetical protein [Microbacteriaceae bacterium]
MSEFSTSVSHECSMLKLKTMSNRRAIMLEVNLLPELTAANAKTIDR